MLAYIIRRLFYAIPILIGVNLLTFMLFFMVNSPDEMARAQLGDKYVTEQTIELWKERNGYHKPLFINTQQQGVERFTDTIFFNKSLKLFALDFGQSESGRDIPRDISQRMGPSLTIALPTFLVGLWVNICVALLVILFRNTSLEKGFVGLFVGLMSISYLFYIIAGQYLAARVWQLVPVSGFQPGWLSLKFLILPVIIGVISGIGSGARLYRTLFLAEADQNYARTARAKGVSELGVLFRHILPNALIPILTNVVIVIPMLFLGSLIMESFFGIPGLGSYTIDALKSQDFAIVRSMVFIGSLLYILGLILTDISYTLVDPRVRLNG
ncbi:MAG: ABC transporter permease [Endozoicomonas sp.]